MKRFLPHIALALVVFQLLLMLVSWMLSSALPMSGVRSMLSGEGIRWFMGHFADMLCTSVLVWILLLTMAYGVVVRSGIHKAFTSAFTRPKASPGVQLPSLNGYRDRRARNIALLFLVGYAAVVALLAIVPHAVLLSASGTLWPSPFSASLPSVIAFGAMATALIYGTVAGRFTTLADVYQSLLAGIRQAAPLLLFYILIVQLYESLCFILP